MKLGIDVSNLRGSGTVIHLIELLRVARPHDYGFDQVIVWGGEATLNRLEERPWLRKVHEPLLDLALPMRLYWQRFMLERLAGEEKCDLLFIPGGLYLGSFRPFVSMSQNLLPFQWSEILRYGIRWNFLRLILLRWGQSETLKVANGVIFLTRYARDVVLQKVKKCGGIYKIISHGVSQQFLCDPRTQRDLKKCSSKQPFSLLYVSTIDMYKHQWHVAEAVAKLKDAGYPVRLDLIGSAYPPALKRLRRTLNRFDPKGYFIHYLGEIPYSEVFSWYLQADVLIFASSCETFGQIVTEAMAAGLPIACSNKDP
jgi:glycosyltransferase involved in cell wall biosynthesis